MLGNLININKYVFNITKYILRKEPIQDTINATFINRRILLYMVYYINRTEEQISKFEKVVFF